MAMPLCDEHHADRHRNTGHFDGWTKLKLQLWESLMVEKYKPREDDESYVVEEA